LWTDRRLTIRIVGPDGERTVDVNKPYARIGSHPRSEVILEGSDVPKHGLYLHATDRGIFSVQLWDSSDDSATCRSWVTPNQGISLGDCQIFASFTDGPEPVADPDWMLDEKGSAQLPVPVIYLLVNEERRATYRVYRSLTVVGREKPSALRLRSDFISLTHCVLYWQDGKLWFVDLLSSNGTEKRGRRCEAERFRLGRTIKIGDVLLGFARTTSDPWDANSANAVAVRETTPATEPKHIFELNAPQPVDARLWSTGDGSSLHNIDGLEDSWEEHGDSDAQLDKDAAEAIKEMRRQLEAERTAWETERLEKERVLAEQHRELDRSFAEIQSWRDELSFRSHQLEHDLVAKRSAQMARDQAALEEDRQALAREREEFEEQIAHWKVWQKSTQDEHAAITAAHRLEAEQNEQRQAELTAMASALELRRQQLDTDIARKRQQVETDLERQRVQLETDLAALQSRQQAFESQLKAVAKQDQTVAAQQQDFAAQRKQLDEARRALAAEQSLLDSQRQAFAADRAQLDADRQALDADRRALASDRQALESQLKSIATDRAELDERRARLTKEQLKLESQRKALLTDRAQLDDRRATLSEEQLELESQRKAIVADRLELESLRESHAAESTAREAARQALTEERKELEGRLQSLARESSDTELTRQELETLRRELNAEQQTLAALRQELDISRQSLDSERAEIALLRQSADGATSARSVEIEQQHQALAELRQEIAEQQQALETQREQWEAEQRQSYAAEQQRLAAAQQEAESAAAEQAARIADAECLLAIREEQTTAAETRLQNELAQLTAARQELEQAQVALHEKQRELQQQNETAKQAQADAQQRLAERQKDVDSLTAELLAQQSVLAAERQELTALCQSLNQDRERAQVEMQEQRSALVATRQEIEALQSQLARDRDASVQIQADLLTQRHQMDEQLAQLRAERESLREERRELDGERQRLEQFAIEQTELLAMLEQEREEQATDNRPRLAEFDDESPAFATNAAQFAADTVDEYDDSDDDNAVQQSVNYEPVAEQNYVFERDETIDEVREHEPSLDEADESIRCEHEYEHDLPPDRHADTPEEPALGDELVRGDEPVPGLAVEANASQFVSDPSVEGAVPVMGTQFEQVDPVLLGEPRTPAGADSESTAAGIPPRPVERIPVDPAADAAYDQLVDRLVQFQQSQKRKWFKFW
jgi:chromosome segregation ATPase